jgi:uncharacterized membrane protein YfcA
MSVLEIIGYFGALLVGLVMGLTGSGGSVLSVPILAYLFGNDEKTATAYSLFIVGFTALVGSFRVLKGNEVSKNAVIYFGIPSIIGVVFVRRILLPILPETLFRIFGFDFSRRMLIFGLFACLMMLSAYSMLKKSKIRISHFRKRTVLGPMMLIGGFLLGIFVGLIGAGGGFLMVPALMIFARMPIKRAVGTSLIIVCLNCLVGFFLGDFFTMEPDWNFLLSFVAVSFVGIIIGGALSAHINSQKLKTGFGYFILLIAVFVFVMEFVLHAMV